MGLFQKKCLPCEGLEKSLDQSEVQKLISQIKNWEVVENRKIKKDFKFKDFKGGMAFVNKVAELAENEQHHPNIYIFYNKVKVELSTYAILGLSEDDFITAAKIDRLENNGT